MNMIRDILKTLTKREENVLRLYFGIDVKRTTLAEIGQDFDKTSNTVRKIKKKGIYKVINRVTNIEHFNSLSSQIDKDLIERCIKERKSKLLDEFIVNLLQSRDVSTKI